MTLINCGDPTYKTIQFEWFLTNWCNYNCSYCSEADNMVDTFDKQSSPSKYKLVLSRLRLITTPFSVELIGGEPTLHPNIVEILSELSSFENCIKIQVITNLSRSVEFYKTISTPKVQFLASFHPEYFSKEFISKVKAIPNVSITLNLSDKSEHWANTIEFLDLVNLEKLSYSLNMLMSTSSYTTSYSDEFFAKFNRYITTAESNEQIQHTFENNETIIFNETEIIQKGLHKLTGYECTPMRYRISHDGEIQNFCTGKKLPLAITINSLYQKETCPNSHCKCDALFVFYKEKK